MVKHFIVGNPKLMVGGDLRLVAHIANLAIDVGRHAHRLPGHGQWRHKQRALPYQACPFQADVRLAEPGIGKHGAAPLAARPAHDVPLIVEQLRMYITGAHFDAKRTNFRAL